MDADKLEQNFFGFVQYVASTEAGIYKGTYVRSITVSTTMGPGIKLDTADAQRQTRGINHDSSKNKLSSKKKQDSLNEIKRANGAPLVVLVNPEGITVEEINAIRRKFEEKRHHLFGSKR